jgi:hypothetical protein
VGIIVFNKFSQQIESLGLGSLHTKFFLVLEIYFLLSDDGERAGWNRFLHGGSVEDAATTTASAFSPV